MKRQPQHRTGILARRLANLFAVGFLTLLTLCSALNSKGQTRLGALQLPCCTITALDANRGLATARENSTGRTFDFLAPSAASLAALKIGQPIYANFRTKQVSLNGKTACCRIVNISPAGSVQTGPKPSQPGTSGPSAAAATRSTISSGLGQITLSSVALNPATITGGASSSGTVALSGPAPSGFVIALSTSDPGVANVPASITVPVGATTAVFNVTTTPISGSASTLITASCTFLDPQTRTARTVSKTATLTVLAPVLERVGIQGSPAPMLPAGSLISLAPCAGALADTSQSGGLPTFGCVTLTGPAPQEAGGQFPLGRGGVQIELSSNNPQVAAVAAAVIVPAGRAGANFTIKTIPVNTDTPVLISARRVRSDDTKTAKLTVLAPRIQGLAITPNSVQGGRPATGKITLTGPAYPGLAVNLSASISPNGRRLVPTGGKQSGGASVPAVTLPASSVTFSGGESSADFNITTASVVGNQSVTVSASFGGVSKSAALTVLASIPIQKLQVRVITSNDWGAGTFDAVYFSIGPSWGWRLKPPYDDFERGSDKTFDLDSPPNATLTTEDILYLRLVKEGLGGKFNAPDSPGGAWEPQQVTLYVNGAPYPNDSCCAVNEWLQQGHATWTHYLGYYTPEELFVRSLRLSPNDPLKSSGEDLGFFTTALGKNQGISGWRWGGVGPSCATGRVIQFATSTDGLATIDLEVQKMEVSSIPVTAYHTPLSSSAQTPGPQGPRALSTLQRSLLGGNPQPQFQVFWLDGTHGIPHTRYVRVECPYYQSRCSPLPQNNSLVRICGDVCRDMDYETWLEIHPRAPSDYSILAPGNPGATSGQDFGVEGQLPAYCQEPPLP
jgi:hypothetical protein